MGAHQARLDQVWLADGELNLLYARLVRTHWIRVALIAAFALLQVVEAVASVREARATRAFGGQRR